MNQSHPDTHSPRYYWEYLKRFGKEAAEAWRKDFLYAFLLALATFVLALVWGDRSLVEGAVLGVEAVVVVFGMTALRHLAHTSFILFRERAHPESGGISETHWGYSVWGGVILLAMTIAIAYGISHSWMRKAPIVLNIPAPSVPIFPPSSMVSATPNVAPHEATRSKPSAASNPLRPSIPYTASQTPPQASGQAAQSPPPATFLDRVVQENRGLTPDDRNRLSTELYECDQFIKETRAVAYKVDVEFGKLSNDRQSGALARNVEEHIKVLRDLDAPEWERYHGLEHFQEKWRYFSDQTEYILGDNAYNVGVGALLNATEGMANSLTSWSRIANRDQQDILSIEAQQQVNFEKNLRQFFDWASLTLQRVKQMRQSLDPNGVVQPLPTNAVAPAVGMFSLKREEPFTARCLGL